MATQTFELVSPFLTIYAPSKKWAGDSSLLLGQTANRLVAGELLIYTGANGVNRHSNVDSDAATTLAAADGKINATTDFAAPYFSETGRGDIITGGSIPVLQFGPFEADTMCFQRANDNTFASGTTTGSLAGGKDAGIKVGAKVYAGPVRNPLSGNFTPTDYVLGAVVDCANASSGARVIGRVSRIVGSGASQKIRIMFGVN